jgi:hypothetical protein
LQFEVSLQLNGGLIIAEIDGWRLRGEAKVMGKSLLKGVMEIREGKGKVEAHNLS